LETRIPQVVKLDILCYWWRHADVIFPCLQIIGFATDDEYLMKC